MSAAGSTSAALLYELACAFAARLDQEELIPLVLTRCREALDAEGASVMLLDGRELVFHATAEDPEVAAKLRGLRMPADRGIAGAVIASGEAVRIDDVSSDPRFYAAVDRESGARTRALLCVPLRAEDQVVGVVQVVNRRGGGTFTDENLALLEAMAGSIAVALENARVYGDAKASEARLRAEVAVLRRDLARRERFVEIVSHSSEMQEVFDLMESAAGSPIAVLIEGETGTGKELVARGIHQASTRTDGPFVAVNCAAIPESILERELFGHRRGAFTGATQDQRGLFEAADGGTIFLDEVGDMPASMQAKLLRVLEDGAVVPLGDSRPRRVDVRILSATHRELSTRVTDGSFREDLYYRLAAFPIRVPPLRARRGDVPVLVPPLLQAAAERHGKQIAGIDGEALGMLERHPWPGNVRELQNEIERAVAVARDGEQIEGRHLSARVRGTTAAAPADASAPATLREARAAFESRHIAEALRRDGGNVSRAARALGLSRAMLQRKMKAYDLR